MAAVTKLQTNPISGFPPSPISWVHLEGSPKFDYPIDYWSAILGARPETGSIDFLIKWAPDAYCHFHRHVGETTTLVLEAQWRNIKWHGFVHEQVRTRDDSNCDIADCPTYGMRRCRVEQLPHAVLTSKADRPGVGATPSFAALRARQ